MLSLKDYKLVDKDTNVSIGEQVGKQACIKIGDYTLSVITGPGAYGGGLGMYEIAIFNQDGEFTKLPGIHKEVEDDVIGYLSEKDVDLIILKLYYASGGVQPVQVTGEVAEA